MPLINCIVGLKLKWRKYCILSVAGNENDINNNDKDNNNIFTVKDKKIICSCSKFISKRQSKTILAKDLKDQDHYRLKAVDLSRQKELGANPKEIQEVKLIGQLKRLNVHDKATKAGHNDESIFVLTVLAKIKETRLKPL